MKTQHRATEFSMIFAMDPSRLLILQLDVQTLIFLPEGARGCQQPKQGESTSSGPPHCARAKPTPLCVVSGAGGKRSWVGRAAGFSRTFLITLMCLL